MNEKLPSAPTEWRDPDDAPELTNVFFEKATMMIGGQPVTLEKAKMEFAKINIPSSRSPTEHRKQHLTLRFDADIIAAFKSTGRGWQERMNDALRDWLNSHSLT